MAYEIDFVGLDHNSGDADAIAFRWLNHNGTYTVGVYDGGTSEYGEELCKLLNKYYFSSDMEKDEKVIDFVICSHSDQDHVVGLKSVLENFNVKTLYMNRPWLYVNELWSNVNDGRITKESLAERLKEKYKYIYELEKIANDNSVSIRNAFQGTLIKDKLSVLSPTKDFYLQLLVESDKTPLIEEQSRGTEVFSSAAKKELNFIKDIWHKDSLREDVSTSAENEMSIIVHGEDENNFLLVGDAGIRAFGIAADFIECSGKTLKDVKFYQMPHHGGRHNLSPSIMKRIVGEIIPQGEKGAKVAFVSAGKGSEHPKKVVVNDFIKRGVKVCETKGQSIWYHIGTPIRDEYSSLPGLSYSDEIEDWEC